MVKRIACIEAVAGCAWVGIMFYGATHPLMHLTLTGTVLNQFVAGLILFLVGSLIGVGFNIRHRQDSFSLTGRIFNYTVAVGSFAYLFVTLPILYTVSPVIVLTLLMAALLSLASLLVPDDSPLEIFLPVLATLPLLSRYGFGALEPMAQSAFWKWTELAFAVAAPFSIHFINRESERIVGAGPRAKWIWLHSLHSILLGLILLALNRGAEDTITTATVNRAGGALAVVGAKSDQSPLVESNDTAEEREGLLWLGGGLSIISALGMAIKSGLLLRLMRGEVVDAISCVAIGMILLVGLWTVFARDVSEKDRQFGAFAGVIWGLPLLFILGISFFS